MDHHGEDADFLPGTYSLSLLDIMHGASKGTFKILLLGQSQLETFKVQPETHQPNVIFIK